MTFLQLTFNFKSVFLIIIGSSSAKSQSERDKNLWAAERARVWAMSEAEKIEYEALRAAELE